MKINTIFPRLKISITLFLFASTLVLGQTTPTFGSTQGPTLLSGTDRTAGARYLYTNVALNVNGGTLNADAVLTIIQLNNITIDDVDTALGVDNRFEPTTTTTAPNGFVEWEILFVESGTASATESGAPILIDSYTLEAIDVDGQEFFEVLVPDSFTIEGGNLPLPAGCPQASSATNNALGCPTDLVAALNGDFVRFQSDADFSQGVLAARTEYIVSVTYNNVSRVRFRNGQSIVGNSRQNSISFLGEVNFINPLTVPVNTPPTVVDNTGGQMIQNVTPNISRNVLDGSSDNEGNLDVATLLLIDPDDSSNTATLGESLIIPGVGSYTPDGAGNVTFTPIASFSGEALANFRVEDTAAASSNIASLRILVLANADGDGLLDDEDTDDDNDGIPDSEEDTNCLVVTDLNTPNFTENTDLVNGGATGTAMLNGLDSGVINFSASVGGTATWNNGIQIQNDPGVGDFIFAQPQNTDNTGTVNVATYVFDFTTPISDFTFVLGGLNNDDQVTITARMGGMPITIDSRNFSGLDAGIVVTGNSVRGTTFDNDPDPLINLFTTTIFGPVDQVTITSGKANNSNSNVTVGMYSFGYCTGSAGPADFDNDGIPNSKDLDSDNDGILDVIEGGGIDPDNDGVIGSGAIMDTDGDGLSDIVDPDDMGTALPLPNTDGSGNPNYLDIDADDDGIPDNVEAQPTDNYIPPSGNGPGITDMNENGVDDAYENGGNIGLTPENTDGTLPTSDTIPDYVDDDSDNDSFPDIDEANLGMFTDVDSDNDGLDDGFEGTDNNDGPDVNNELNTGAIATENNDDADLTEVDFRADSDTDDDGIIDNIDLDDDNDGIPDITESDGNDPNGDEDGDGIPNWGDNTDDGNGGDGSTTEYTDTNGDGIPDIYDSDNDGVPNHLDLDSDNDGVPDIIEAGGTDVNGDGHIDYPTPGDPTSLQDSNNDGLDDTIANTPLSDPDSDGDGVADRLDLDSDNDGIPDVTEAGGTDADGDGTIDGFADLDGDGYADSVDTDDDTAPGMGDGGTALPDSDSDGDGVADRLDLDSDNDGIPDVTEAGGSDPDNDGSIGTGPITDADGDGYDDSVDPDDNTTPTPLDGTGNSLPQDDFDGDGRPNYLDIDSDNDGITDTTEAGGTDADGDGTVDGFIDTDGDGLDDATAADPLPIPNSDGNANDGPDYLDIDADDDGIVDNIEGQSTAGYTPPSGNDTDMDGLDNAYDANDNGNPIVPVDNDRDTNPDYLDMDSDEDGINDIIEGWDTDGDGTPEVVPTGADADGDGLDDAFDTDDADPEPSNGQTPLDFPDVQTPGDDRDWRQGLDNDNDGINDDVDLDDDNDGIPDTVEGMGDFDGDGIPNVFDLDSDNDGIPDVTEAGGTDSDGDGTIDGFTDIDSDGLDDATAADPLPVPNSDGNANDGPDYLDIDADDDGIVDNIEGQSTTGYTPPSGNDTDGDGLDDAYDMDNGGIALVPVNTDGADNPDYLDTDTDNDGIDDIVEGWDTNGDGTPEVVPAGTDADGDGLDDAFDNDDADPNPSNGQTPLNFPDVQIPGDDRDWRQGTDSDGDGVSDAQEITDGTGPNDPCDFMAASVSLPQMGNFLLADCDGDGVTNGDELAGPDGDPITADDNTDPGDPCDFDIGSITLAQTGDYLVADCDGDGVANGTEIDNGTNPEDSCDFVLTNVTLDFTGDYLLEDCDGDQITNGQELIDNTDPNDPCDSVGGTPPENADCDPDVSRIEVQNTIVTADGDGINDVFAIVNIESFPNNTVRIYNRWGILVFETSGYNNTTNAFRGISNGRATLSESDGLPVGVYFYTIEFVDNDQNNTLSGYLYINR